MLINTNIKSYIELRIEALKRDPVRNVRLIRKWERKLRNLDK